MHAVETHGCNGREWLKSKVHLHYGCTRFEPMAAGTPAPPPPPSPAAVAAFFASAQCLPGDRAGGVHGRGVVALVCCCCQLEWRLRLQARNAARRVNRGKSSGVAGVSRDGHSRWEEDQAGDKFVRDDAGRQHSKLPGKSQASWLSCCHVRFSCIWSQSWCTIIPQSHPSLIT